MLIATLISIIILAGIILFFWYLMKQNKGMSLGDAVTVYLIKQHSTVGLIGLILFNVGEAFMAANIHPSGEAYMSPVARNITHFAVGFLGIVMGLRAITEFANCFNPTVTKDRMGQQVVLTAIALTIATILPLINIATIAGGLQQLYYVFNFSLGSYAKMAYPMQASMGLLLGHFLMVLWEGASVTMTASKIVNDKMAGKTIDEKINKRGEEEKSSKDKEGKKEEKDPIVFLANAYGFRKEGQTSAVIKKAQEMLKHLDDVAEATFARNASELMIEIQRNKLSNKEKRQKIYKLFASTSKNGEGLAYNLPGGDPSAEKN